MSELSWVAVLIPLVMWVGLLWMPWQPWRNREHIEADVQNVGLDLSDITVLIPARNEADVIGATLAGLASQGDGLQVIVIDDQSDDDTGRIAATFENTRVMSGQPLPSGWAGKLWALEQGRSHVTTPLVLLLDADIQLQPGLLATLLLHKRNDKRHFVSLMADLRRTSIWDRLLLPAFVYYFKLIYPFAVSNSNSRLVAAAAGGCVLVDAEALHKVGAFGSLRDALIDDCALARQVKDAGYRTWVGLSRDVVSLRPYGSLRSIHEMVARSAFTQLGYSTALLLAVTLLFAMAYGLPFVMVASAAQRPWALAAWAAMTLSYLPTLRYYRMSLAWALLLPASAALYMAMTWSSAIRYWRGVRSRWKGRTYST